MVHYHQIGNRIVRQAAIIAIVLAVALPAAGVTLFDGSLKKLQTKAETVSSQDFTFVVLGDSRDNDTVFRKSLVLAARYNPLFILHGGDFSGSGSPAETAHFLAVVKEELRDLPLFVIFGNHERKETFEKMVGPLHYTIDLPRLNFRLTAVDNAAYALNPAEMEFLRTKLEGAPRFSFVAAHIPPKTTRWNWHTFSKGAEDFTRLLAAKKVTMAFYGHIHLYDRAEVEGVPSIITGGAGAPLTPFAFAGDPVYHLIVVRVKDGTVNATMVPVPE